LNTSQPNGAGFFSCVVSGGGSRAGHNSMHQPCMPAHPLLHLSRATVAIQTSCMLCLRQTLLQHLV
jgi:hypothetical protein